MRKHFCSNVFKFFGGCVRKMPDCPEFKQLIILWALHHQFTNMAMERLLALIAKWDAKERGCAERLSAASSVGQMLKEHASLGRDDPRWHSRRQLLSDGVPLRCAGALAKPGRSYQCGSFIHFLSKADRSRSSRMNKASCRA